MATQKYYKSPVASALPDDVEAEQFLPQNRPWPGYVHPWSEKGVQPRDMSWGYIERPGGDIHVMAGDWILVNAQGYVFTCSDDLFRVLYKLAPISTTGNKPMDSFMEVDGVKYRVYWSDATQRFESEMV